MFRKKHNAETQGHRGTEINVKIRRQHRRSLMMRAVPGGIEVYIPRWMKADSPKVRAFIQAGIAKMGGQVQPIPAEQTSREQMRALVDEWAARIGVQPKRVQFREMQRKWGSCSSRDTVTLNTRLGWLPLRLVEYVVVHELVHLRVLNHGKEFKALMSAYLPDWKEREWELKGIHF